MTIRSSGARTFVNRELAVLHGHRDDLVLESATLDRVQRPLVRLERERGFADHQRRKVVTWASDPPYRPMAVRTPSITKGSGIPTPSAR
jgi:hypothetical protein